MPDSPAQYIISTSEKLLLHKEALTTQEQHLYVVQPSFKYRSFVT